MWPSYKSRSIFAPYFGGQKLDLYAEKYGTSVKLNET